MDDFNSFKYKTDHNEIRSFKYMWLLKSRIDTKSLKLIYLKPYQISNNQMPMSVSCSKFIREFKYQIDSDTELSKKSYYDSEFSSLIKKEIL